MILIGLPLTMTRSKFIHFERSLDVSVLREVDIGVPQGLASDHVPAHPDGEDRSSRRELLKEHRLGGLLCQVADVEGGQGTLVIGVAFRH